MRCFNFTTIPLASIANQQFSYTGRGQTSRWAEDDANTSASCASSRLEGALPNSTQKVSVPELMVKPRTDIHVLLRNTSESAVWTVVAQELQSRNLRDCSAVALPSELINLTFEFLTVRDIARCALVCKAWSGCTGERRVWANLVIRVQQDVRWHDSWNG